MKRIVLGVILALIATAVVLFGVLAFNTITFTSMQVAPAPRALPEINLERAVTSLQEALRLETISYEEPHLWDFEPFARLHEILEQRFPLVHERLEKETVSDYSLLYTWRGAAPEEKALILLAHQDVVAAPDAAIWEHPPFSGAVADGFIWGRGTLDDKGSMIGILEAVETLLENGFVPERTVYLCFGHDEEVGGWNGAAKTAETLRDRGVTAKMSLDEGMAVIDGALLGLDVPIAFISLTEKGYLSLELTARGNPGHASTPPRETTLGILSRAVTRLEENPMPASLPEPVRLMFRYLGPEMPFPANVVFANLWLTKPLVMRQLASARATDAAIRTTTAVTIMEGGIKDNVLPAEARAVVNFRPKPGKTIEQVIGRVRETINDDRIEVRPLRRPVESPPMARTDGPAFAALQETIRQVFSEAIVAPAMMLGGSDTHHYAEVAEDRYGFLPLDFSVEDLERIHGPNERISVEAFGRMIAFYMMFIEHVAG